MPENMAVPFVGSYQWEAMMYIVTFVSRKRSFDFVTEKKVLLNDQREH